MTIIAINAKTGEECVISRDACTNHPDWVHEQAGTSSESELQSMLDQYDIRYYYDGIDDTTGKGPDIRGIDMRFDSDQERADYLG